MDQNIVISDSSVRGQLRNFLEKSWVNNTILGIIIINAITLGMSTSEWIDGHIGGILGYFEQIVLSSFVLELALKLFAYGF